MKMNPQETVAFLRKEGFTLQDYEEVQGARLKRMKTWKERNIEFMIQGEQELIDFGEEVIRLFKEESPDK